MESLASITDVRPGLAITARKAFHPETAIIVSVTRQELEPGSKGVAENQISCSDPRGQHLLTSIDPDNRSSCERTSVARIGLAGPNSSSSTFLRAMFI